MILCFTLLNDRRNQRERWSVMRRNERFVVRVLVFERGGEGTGDVFAGDLAAPSQAFGRLYVAGALVLCQATGADDGVVEAALLQPLVGSSLGAEVGTHALGTRLGIARAHGAEHEVAANPAALGGLDELGGPAIVHRLL